MPRSTSVSTSISTSFNNLINLYFQKQRAEDPYFKENIGYVITNLFRNKNRI